MTTNSIDSMFISRFCSDIMHPEQPKEGSIHDGMGGTAGDSIAFILGKLRDPELEALWNEIRGSVPEAAE